MFQCRVDHPVDRSMFHVSMQCRPVSIFQRKVDQPVDSSMFHVSMQGRPASIQEYVSCFNVG
jgi:hypothetical protein